VNIGLIPHGARRDADELMREVGDDLVEHGNAVRALEADALRAERPQWAVPKDEFGKELDLVVTLGGDGTVLRAVSLTQARRVPLLPVNLGQMGYLTEVEPQAARASIHRFIDGRHRIETRMTVAARLEPDAHELEGLNEIVVSGEVGRLAYLSCRIDEAEFTVYRCDALLVATSTGSTAYALSAGGPIVSPGLDCLIVVPVAPHGLFNRPLVLRPDEGLILQIASDQPATISVDGRQRCEMKPGQELHLGRGPEEVPFVRFTDLDFLGMLRTKFGLSTPEHGAR
jgi:NAD+ kinase